MTRIPFNNASSAERDGTDAVGQTDRPAEEMATFSERVTRKGRGAGRARLRRRERIQRAADAALEQWERLLGLPAPEPPIDSEDPLLRPLPQPQVWEIPKDERSSLPPPRRGPAFKAGVLRPVGRLLFWLGGGLLFALKVLWDWIRGCNTQQNRARHLRETFQLLGTTFIKIGQQLSMRLDLLPYIYTRELEKLLDDVKAFPSADAIKIIERTTGRSLDQIFAAFDPQPIGSASVACVYQAVLNTGERVAVKVRRPGIGPRLASDMRAFGWLLAVIEMIHFTPGFTKNFVEELKTMLMEELDFVREARFTDLYRRHVRKVKQLRFVTAPKVFFEHSNDEVLITEFVSGIWVKDVLTALETENQEVLAKLEEMNFDRVIVARRIQLIARFNNFENIFFHADLHPANILIRPGNNIVLIDFGSCGSFNRRELNSWRRWFDAQSVNDVGGMVQAALGILEPLPPINKDDFGMRLESKFWDDLYAIKSKHSVWSERISARLWIGFLDLSRQFRVPLKLNTIRMIRASMLSDTIANRLDNNQDPYREFRFYERGAGKRAEKRLTKRVHSLLGPSKFIRIHEALETSLNLLYQVQRIVDSLTSIRIGAIIAKIDYFFTLFFRHLVWVFITTPTYFLAHDFFNRCVHRFIPRLPQATSFNSFFDLLKDPIWDVITFVPMIMVLYRLTFRWKEPEPWGR
jgi:ubiquinone biosynthesis protein